MTRNSPAGEGSMVCASKIIENFICIPFALRRSKRASYHWPPGRERVVRGEIDTLPLRRHRETAPTPRRIVIGSPAAPPCDAPSPHRRRGCVHFISSRKRPHRKEYACVSI